MSYVPIPMRGDVPCKRRLLSSFQSSLSEITVIALPDVGPGGSATNNVKIKSYVDPSKGTMHSAFGYKDWQMQIGGQHLHHYFYEQHGWLVPATVIGVHAVQPTRRRRCTPIWTSVPARCSWTTTTGTTRSAT
jgi:hypothetical protein